MNDSSVSFWKMTSVILLATTTWISATRGGEVRIWDTISPFGSEVDVRDRGNWKLVPTDLLSLEARPSAAASDPGYYGREYSFAGDAVVENEHLMAVFRSKADRVAVYSKVDGSRKIFELSPMRMGRALTEIGRIDHCRPIRNNGNDVALEVFYSGADDSSVVFVFDETEIVEVRLGANVNRVSIFSSIKYGVVPDFVGDDLIFDPGQYPSTERLSIPSENMFLGLLEGQNSVLVITWPKGSQYTGLTLSSRRATRRTIESFNFANFANEGKSLYLAVLSAAGIWHEAQLKPTYLEKDVDMGWQRPFPAKWTIQLDEARVRTTFTFRQSRQNIWRGVTGHYTYPVWFDGDNAFCRFSKKIPPKGRSVIYCLEGKGTPASIMTPVDILKQTLGRQACEDILDFPGRVLRTHHRPGPEGVRRACTCGCTEAIEAVFKVGQEVQRKAYVLGAVDDMLYFVRQHVKRIDEYRAFAEDMKEYLNAKGKSEPDLKPHLDEVMAIVEQIPQEYERNKENMKTMQYAVELARKTRALAQRKDAGNLSVCLELGKQWRSMGGAQDNVIGAYHSITRKLAQEAGYGIAARFEGLRNADGYEIWPDY
jgi:hypothetical protein